MNTLEQAMPIVMLTWGEVMNTEPLYGAQMLHLAEALCRRQEHIDGHKIVMLGPINGIARPPTIHPRLVADLGLVLEGIGWLVRTEPPRPEHVARWRSTLFDKGVRQ